MQCFGHRPQSEGIMDSRASYDVQMGGAGIRNRLQSEIHPGGPIIIYYLELDALVVAKPPVTLYKCRGGHIRSRRYGSCLVMMTTITSS